MRLFVFILFLIPSLALALPAELSWDLNPPDEQVTEYRIYKDGTYLTSSTDNKQSIEIIGGECYTLSAVNLAAESLQTPKLCVPNTPGTPASVTITYTDANGNAVVIKVPIPNG